jgi:hypothetical protein
VRDGVLIRLIGKWLRAGVMEEGSVYYPDSGTPQGGVVSPILANVFLHEVLDVWFEQEVKPRLMGKAFLVRYADDAVAVFATERDARRVMAVLPKRFEKYGLRLHPTKTKLVRFQRPRYGSNSKKDDPTRPGSFDFLGFRHYWGRSQKGNWVVKRKTAQSRFSRALRRIATWCRTNRHLPIAEQHRVLTSKLRGHDAYYGITGNSRMLSLLRYWVRREWFKWLQRRSHAARRGWEWMERLTKVLPLPMPRIVHSALPSVAKP